MKPEDRYDSMIAWAWELAAVEFHVDPIITWHLPKEVIRAESAFNPSAKSGVGAVGLMQLMPSTALDYGVDNRENPEKNIRGGTRHLAKMWFIFKAEKGIERVKFALGAYNAGQGNIIEAQSAAHARGFDPARWVSIVQVLPQVTTEKKAAETTNYVSKIVLAYQGG